jgi:hypothetical protein
VITSQFLERERERERERESPAIEVVLPYMDE